ncbi:hypothetical protein BG015_009209 [Linnemannia schmuckeri]|uniref:Chromate transporter n=1 Tax=Linnemannia schmuckeri TaxID=64567 RepID=A0A9P5RY01_9FUNG|nr:hypothetical protein BG015_009209 [Linnemannia schmuckeri]
MSKTEVDTVNSDDRISEKHASSSSSSDTTPTTTIDLPTTPSTDPTPPSDPLDTSLTPLNEFEDSTNLPQNQTLFQIFTFFFFHFGLHAWGGSVAQIALLKTELVQKRRWITIARFNRVYAVYQMLPGPEAAEICMFFGCLVGGRMGGIVAGLGFILPGFLAMVLLSYLYTIAGLDNVYFNASFRALQPVVAAMVLRAVFQIGQHAFISSKTKQFNKVLFILAILGALQSALRINYFITLGVFGIFYNFYTRGWRWAAGGVMVLNYVGYILYVVFKGVPSPSALALGVATVPDMPHLLALGLVAGSLSFGGAYTSIPFIQAEAVVLGGWLAKQTFLDGIALGNIIPAPLVIFSTFVGFQGGHTYGEGSLGYAFGGCVLITLGMFLPCFIFTIMGHALLERICKNETMASFFDGITGSVVGIIAITALEILKASVVHLPKPGVVLDGEEWLLLAAQNTLSAVIFVMAFMILNSVRHQYLSVLLIIIAAIAGQFLFV